MKEDCNTTRLEIVVNDDIEIDTDRNDLGEISCIDIASVLTDCCDDSDDEDLENVSTQANMDSGELPLLSRIRIYLVETRRFVFPAAMIISGSFTSLISVGRPGILSSKY